MELGDGDLNEAASGVSGLWLANALQLDYFEFYKPAMTQLRVGTSHRNRRYEFTIATAVAAGCAAAT